MTAKQKASKRPGLRGFERVLENAARAVTNWTGSTSAFALSFSIVLAWLLTGPLFHYSDTWQLVINTGTTIITFLMVFLIQRSQNKDSLALHLKLNEVVAAMKGASNRLIDVEALSERELHALHTHYQTLAQMAKRDLDRLCSHSVEEAEHRHHRKAVASKREQELEERTVTDEAKA
ncbi:MAG TPA: low affinity iron permease family protein [Polyangiaceae bacterium]|nr:low affinity iron permease family protein [Polyangiaceae bacterium]